MVIHVVEWAGSDIYVSVLIESIDTRGRKNVMIANGDSCCGARWLRYLCFNLDRILRITALRRTWISLRIISTTSHRISYKLVLPPGYFRRKVVKVWYIERAGQHTISAQAGNRTPVTRSTPRRQYLCKQELKRKWFQFNFVILLLILKETLHSQINETDGMKVNDIWSVNI